MKTFQWIFETGGEIEVPDDTTEAQAKEILIDRLTENLAEGIESFIVWES